MSSFIERPRFHCALGGALNAVNAIDRAVAIVHASPGCAASADGSAAIGSGYWGSAACTGRATPSTNLQEREIVFGGEQRLAEQIEKTLEIVDADLFAVITGCMTDIIGDDVKAVVREFQRRGVPIVVAETGGFKGTSAEGYELIWQAVVEQFVERGRPRQPRTVNLIGLVPTQDVFWRGNLLELRRLLEAIGLRVNTLHGPFDEPASIKHSSEAALDIVLSDTTGVRVAECFERVHGVPYVVEPLPVGPAATKRFLESIAARLALDAGRVERVIAEEARWYYAFIQHVADVFNDQDFQRHAIVVGHAPIAYAVTRFLADDFSWLPHTAVITDQLDAPARERVAARFATLPEDLRPHLLFETDTTRVAASVLQHATADRTPYGIAASPAFVLGSTLDRPLAAALQAGFHAVSFPIVNRVVTDQGYAGYRGGLRLATEILSVLLSNR